MLNLNSTHTSVVETPYCRKVRDQTQEELQESVFSKKIQFLESSLIGMKLNALATAKKSNCETSEEDEL